MRFWDSSAIIPLCLEEPASEKIRDLAEKDEDLIVWWATRVECLSALARRRREEGLTSGAELSARTALSALPAEWSEVQPSESVRQRAARLLMVHALRAADAMQLASALLWSGEETSGAEFVCLNQNLRAAALREGFIVLP